MIRHTACETTHGNPILFSDLSWDIIALYQHLKGMSCGPRMLQFSEEEGVCMGTLNYTPFFIVHQI